MSNHLAQQASSTWTGTLGSYYPGPSTTPLWSGTSGTTSFATWAVPFRNLEDVLDESTPAAKELVEEAKTKARWLLGEEKAKLVSANELLILGLLAQMAEGRVKA